MFENPYDSKLKDGKSSVFRNYLLIAIRNLLRHKVYSTINLFGLAVPLDQTTMDAKAALISVDESGATAASDGYSIVVSPSINPDPFILTRPLAAQDLTRSRGYWVFMQNDDTLAGFSTTPVDP